MQQLLAFQLVTKRGKWSKCFKRSYLVVYNIVKDEGYCESVPFENKNVSLHTSEMQTWTMRPPSSKPRTRSSNAHEQHNYNLPSWSPARHSVEPDRGNRCIWRRVLASVFCSVCRRVKWGWFCAKPKTLRWATASSVARARSPSRAASAAPRRTEGCCCCC